MKITEFGRLVRKARLDARVTLLDMATVLQVSSAFLSGLETGRKKVSEEWVLKIRNYFAQRGVHVEGLAQAADVANKSVSLEGLSPAHQMLVAGFARTSLDEQQIRNLQQLLEAASLGVKKNDGR